jgi:cobalt-zinc-cadmium efflux system membrane fusion protein
MRTTTTIILGLVLAMAAPACGNDDPHDHSTTQAHDDHDHDHGHAGEVKLTPEAIRNAKIRVEPVKKHALLATFTAHARVAFNAEAMAHVGSPVAGRVVEVKARLGDAVKRGDALLFIESAELGRAQSDYLRDRTSLTVAESAIEPVKQSTERARKLHEQEQGISLGELQKREAELKAAEGTALSAKTDVVAARNRLLLLGMTADGVKAMEDAGALNPKLAILAPLAGRVIEREVTLGEMVSPEKDKLMVIASDEVLWVLADVAEARLPSVTIGSPARVQLAALPGKTFEGKVAHVAPALNPDTRSGTVRIEVPNTDRALRPGMFASVVLTTGADDDDDDAPVLAIPDEAVQTVEGEPSVFVPVEGEENTFARRAIKVGKPIGGMLPIEGGVKEGESIVVSGTFILKAELGKGEAAHEH